MPQPLDMSWHPWYTKINQTNSMDNNNGITYIRNFKELVWYQEYIHQNDTLIGEVFTNITDGGYNLRKLVPAGAVEIMETIAHFTTVSDAKAFVNQAGGL